MLGEHGNQQFAPWSCVSFRGMPLDVWAETDERFRFDREALQKESIGGGWVTFSGKQCTEYGIATTAARMAYIVLHDEKAIMPASAELCGEYGETGLFAGVPCVLAASGVEQVIELPLSAEEQGNSTAAARASAAICSISRNYKKPFRQEIMTMNISMTKTTHPGKLPPADRLGFGSVFTDHMFLMNYTDREGWHNARIVPFGPISISPAASVLHYGTEVFEGLKAYRRPDGAVQLFRPWENVARLNRSCDRLGLPRINERDGLQAIRELVKMDAAWVPSAPGTSLYIRPFLYSTDPTLALHGVHEATFAIILSPSGSYFSDGLKPVPIMVETEDVRAVRGGTGEAKCGGNYAAANRAGDKALEKGYSQVLWLDGVERKYVEEGGGMNVMFKIAGTVVTPMLTGSILPGITRKSCIELLKSWGVPVEERLLSVDELFEAAKNGTLEEAWCVGTAAVISPIGELAWNEETFEVNQNRIGALSQRLYDELTGIQWGTRPDPFGWTCVV